jgi:hypothetical protein
MQEDPWFSSIEEHLHTHLEKYTVPGGHEIDPLELYSTCIGGSRASFRIPEANRIATILKSLGFEKRQMIGKLGFVYFKKEGV